MSEQHDVTVYDRVPATAAVSLTQTEGYLRRTGWLESRLASVGATRWSPPAVLPRPRPAWNDPSFAIWGDEGAARLGRVIGYVAELEGRQPSAVLADIAKEEA